MPPFRVVHSPTFVTHLNFDTLPSFESQSNSPLEQQEARGEDTASVPSAVHMPHACHEVANASVHLSQLIPPAVAIVCIHVLFFTASDGSPLTARSLLVYMAMWYVRCVSTCIGCQRDQCLYGQTLCNVRSKPSCLQHKRAGQTLSEL